MAMAMATETRSCSASDAWLNGCPSKITRGDLGPQRLQIRQRFRGCDQLLALGLDHPRTLVQLLLAPRLRRLQLLDSLLRGVELLLERFPASDESRPLRLECVDRAELRQPGLELLTQLGHRDFRLRDVVVERVRLQLRFQPRDLAPCVGALTEGLRALRIFAREVEAHQLPQHLELLRRPRPLERTRVKRQRAHQLLEEALRLFQVHTVALDHELRLARLGVGLPDDRQLTLVVAELQLDGAVLGSVSHGLIGDRPLPTERHDDRPQDGALPRAVVAAQDHGLAVGIDLHHVQLEYVPRLES
jgi:hypothetical protein